MIRVEYSRHRHRALGHVPAVDVGGQHVGHCIGAVDVGPASTSCASSGLNLWTTRALLIATRVAFRSSPS